MKTKANNKIMLNIKDVDKSNWKSVSSKYLKELQSFLDKVENIENEELKKDILFQMLKCDDALTKLAEELFNLYYQKGLKDAIKE